MVISSRAGSIMDFDDMSVLLELPYRCPRCGETRRFPSLSALKSHLEYEHTYSTEPLPRKETFSPPKGYKSAFRPWEHFSAEAKELERQLALAKETEKRHKRERESPSNLINNRQNRFEEVPRTSRDNFYRTEDLHRNKTHSPKLENKHLDLIEKLKDELKKKEKELEKANDDLQKLIVEKRKLQKDNLDLNKQLDSHIEYIADLKQQLQEKDRLVQEKERTTSFMNNFLKATAEKEASAKEQVKSYIESLTQRAEQAENEVKRYHSLGSRSNSVNRVFPHDLHGSMSNIGQNPSLLTNPSLITRPQSAPNPELYNPGRPPTVNSFMDSPPNRRHTVGITPLQIQNMRLQQQQQQQQQQLLSSSANIYYPQGNRPPGGSSNRPPSRRHTVGITPQQLNGMFQQQPTQGYITLVLSHNPKSKSNLPVFYANSGISSNGPSPKGTPRQYPMQRPGMHSPANEYRTYNGGIVPEEPMELQDLQTTNTSMTPQQTGVGPLLNGFRNAYDSYPDDGDDMGIDMMEAAYNEIARKKAERSRDQKQQLIQKEMERLQRMSSYDEEELSDTVTMVTDEYDDSDIDIDASQGELPKELVARKENPVLEKRKRYRDALLCVFSYLETRSLLKVALVSKDWMEVSRHPSLWRKVKLANHRISSHFLESLSKWCTELQYLSLEGLRGRKIKSRETTGEYMDKLRGCLEPGLEFLLKASADSLTTLRISDCSNIVTDRALWLASCHCRNLQNIMYISETDPIGHEVIWALGAGCRNVVSFQVPPMHPCQKPHKFNNRCMQMIGRCWPMLRALGVGGIDVDAKGLVSIAKNCSKLQLLEVDHMFEVTEEIAVAMCENGLRDLETLIFTATPVTPKALLQFYNSCPRLMAININVGISDYFADPTKQSNIDEFNRVIAKLKSLKKRPEMSNILHIRSDYG
ncbi:uncharacterized protein LOC144446194 [Glandiceps talaboti]